MKTYKIFSVLAILFVISGCNSLINPPRVNIQKGEYEAKNVPVRSSTEATYSERRHAESKAIEAMTRVFEKGGMTGIELAQAIKEIKNGDFSRYNKRTERNYNSKRTYENISSNSDTPTTHRRKIKTGAAARVGASSHRKALAERENVGTPTNNNL